MKCEHCDARAMCGLIISVRLRLDELIEDQGGLRAAARHLRVNPSYISRVWNGKLPPSDAFLATIGMERIVIYRRLVKRKAPVKSRRK